MERDLEELRQFIYLMPVAVIRLGPGGDVEMLNSKAVQLLHDIDLDPVNTEGTEILDRLDPGLSGIWRASVGRVGAVMPEQQCTMLRPGKPALHLQLRLVRPDARCTMLTVEDVTTTVEQERELERQRRRLGVVLEHIHGYCATMVDVEGTVSDWNPSIGRFFGVAARDIVGKPLFEFMAAGALPSEPIPDFAAVGKAVVRQGWCRLHAPWRSVGGQVLWGDCIVTPLMESDGAAGGYVVIIRDVTDEHWRTQKRIDAALTDPLTRLYNRRGLEQRADALLARHSMRPESNAWIMIDVDQFKHVNDAHGHDAGDAVLQSVAAALQTAAREGDILARYGGEEFVLLLPDTTTATATQVADRLRLNIEALPVQVAGRPIHVTASFGVAQQSLIEPRSAVLERAGAALRAAKHAGRNRVTVSAENSPR
jgi:diguanylate cyclase (GGDEF)-like protein/PAS domain S-box-containing protein